ncbi:prominin-1-A isoform X1 [Cherax quadricarinatus]|uniref:prominin-1-A isoform X1 n=1 Tax=Cherax quadricarinatus TaxID=27406 RepID=UPI00387E6320
MSATMCVLLALWVHGSLGTASSATPYPGTTPPPQVTVAVKVLRQNTTAETSNKSSSLGTVPHEGHTTQGTTEVAQRESTPSITVPRTTSTSPPLPIVTITSRLLYDGRQEVGEEDMGTSRSLAHDPVPKNLQFEAVPEGEPYTTDTTHTTPTLLAWAGALITSLQPTHFPFEVVRAAWERRVTVTQLIWECVEAEPGMAACVGVGVGLSVGVPVVGMVVCCCRLCGRCGGSLRHHHNNNVSCFHCHRRALTLALSTISCLLLIGVVLVVVSNERLAEAVRGAPGSINNNVRDLDIFLANTKLQLRFLITDSFEKTVQAITEDLDDVEYLLGRPLQRELAGEAQIEVALDSLLHISSGLRDIAGRMRALEESRSQAAARAEELRGRLSELSADLQRFVARCSLEDLDLCNTLDYRGLELGARFHSFSFSEQLRLLAIVENHNLTDTARRARYEYENIPNYVKVMTRPTREEVKRVVRGYRASLYSKVRNLDHMAFDLEVRTKELSWRVEEATSDLNLHENYRWYTVLGVVVGLSLVWVLMTVGVCCGCCAYTADHHPTERSCVSHLAGKTLIASVFFMFVLSGVLWMAVVAALLVGVHAHAFICRPLYEEPHFPTLTHLLDHSGMVYPDLPILSNVLHPGRNVHLSIGHVLSGCKEGRAAYQVFQLRHYFDVEREVDHLTTLDLRHTLAAFSVNLSQMEFLSPEAEAHLNDFLRSIKMDLEPYRREIEKPLVLKSVPALSEQMQNVAGQLRSVSGAAELFRMVARTRNIVTNTLYPLEKRKEDLTYHVATLDMEVTPLQRQINQSAGHLRTIQYFIHNHGSSLAAAKARGYVERILGYTRQYTDHVRTSAVHTVAPCTPVWNVFDSARGITCNGIIEPVNVLWVSASWCLLLFLPAVCVSLSLSRYFLRLQYDAHALPLHSDVSPRGSTINLQSESSAAMWGPKQSTSSRAQHQSLTSHHQNGVSHW